MEKAFAKFCGSYGALEGGLTAWALEAMSEYIWMVVTKIVYSVVLLVPGGR